jgi:hypothetical protein
MHRTRTPGLPGPPRCTATQRSSTTMLRTARADGCSGAGRLAERPEPRPGQRDQFNLFEKIEGDYLCVCRCRAHKETRPASHQNPYGIVG